MFLSCFSTDRHMPVLQKSTVSLGKGSSGSGNSSLQVGKTYKFGAHSTALLPADYSFYRLALLVLYSARAMVEWESFMRKGFSCIHYIYIF